MTKAHSLAAGVTTLVAALCGVAVVRYAVGKRIPLPSVLANYPKVKQLIAEKVEQLSDEALVKLLRQLEFWASEGLSGSDLVLLTKRLLFIATIAKSGFQCPKVRFGKTELQMPIVTCGGMRIQWSWVPDTSMIATPHLKRVLQGACQENLKESIRACLRAGINHFETARGYGTSECQLAQALGEMLKEGEIKRSDFILQTKLPVRPLGVFAENWDRSWEHFGDAVGHIDLLGFHVVSTKEGVEKVLSDADDGVMAFVQNLKAQGKIRHIGFSTHGTASNIMQLINSNKFDYINIHCHYFGDYHAQGTMNGINEDQQGNKAAVERALELDMGVFLISPLDKGGMVYRPSATVTRLIGHKLLSPISFVCLQAWKKRGMHTVSLGISKPSDVDEFLEAAYLYGKGGYETELTASEDRLQAKMADTLGAAWMKYGLLGLPDCEQPCTNGVAMGHILWVRDLVESLGMYEFAKARYVNLENQKWDNKKSFDENRKAMAPGNQGRGYIPVGVDYDESLKDHYDPETALEKMKQAHEWLGKKAKYTDADLKMRGWDRAYNLTVWDDYPTWGGVISLQSVLLQCLTGGILGSGGPTGQFRTYSREIRQLICSPR